MEIKQLGADFLAAAALLQAKNPQLQLVLAAANESRQKTVTHPATGITRR